MNGTVVLEQSGARLLRRTQPWYDQHGDGEGA